MNETPEAYGGLPIPTYDEWEFLQAQIDKVMADESNLLELLYDNVLGTSRYLQDIIQYDIEQFQIHGAPDGMSLKQRKEYTRGMQLGYSLIASCFTFMYFKRSEFTDFDSYIDAAPDRIGELPLMSRKEADRVKSVRLGKACVDAYIRRDIVEDSSELPSFNMVSYLKHAVRMEALLDSTMEQQYMEMEGEHNETDGDPSYEGGFWHGVAGAIEVYIQSREEQLFAQLQKTA